MRAFHASCRLRVRFTHPTRLLLSARGPLGSRLNDGADAEAEVGDVFFGQKAFQAFQEGSFPERQFLDQGRMGHQDFQFAAADADGAGVLGRQLPGRLSGIL